MSIGCSGDIQATSDGCSADDRATSEGTGTGTGTVTMITTGSVQLPTHSASVGGAGGKAGGRVGEYDGIWLNPTDRSSDMVPIRAWHRLKHFIDLAGLRMEFEADYRATADKLHEKFGLPLRGGAAETAGFEQEVWLFKRWHQRIHGGSPSRWPWHPIPEAP